MEGQDLSVTKKIWDDLAATEMRLKLMSDLLNINVGFADIEEFNLNLKGNLKNLLSDKTNEIVNVKLVRAAMSVKIKRTNHKREANKSQKQSKDKLDEETWTKYQKIQVSDQGPQTICQGNQDPSPENL